MKYILSHTAAIVWYMRHESPRARGDRTSRASVTGSSVPNAASVARLQWFLDLEGVPLDVLVDDQRFCRCTKSLRVHLCTRELPEGSLIAITSPWSDIPLYVVCPELAYLQVVHRSELPTAVYAGMALCSDYRIDLNADGGVVQRARTDRRPTTLASIARYLDRAKGLTAVRPARTALQYVREHSRSPKESGLAMFYGLPCHYGGAGLGDVTLNPRIDIYAGKNRFGEIQTEARYPDILITANAKGVRYDVAFDYDADSTHKGQSKATKDRRRADAIAKVRSLIHFTLATDDISDFDYLVLMGERARRALKQRPRPLLDVPRESARGRELLRQYNDRRFDLFVSYVQGLRDF